jgi:hypothetical protein
MRRLPGKATKLALGLTRGKGELDGGEEGVVGEEAEGGRKGGREGGREGSVSK